MKKLLLLITALFLLASVEGQILRYSNYTAPAGGAKNLLNNGTFDNTDYWTLGSGWSISSGVLSYDYNLAANVDQEGANMISSMLSGTDYKLTFDINVTSGDPATLIFRDNSYEFVASDTYATGSHTVYFTTPDTIGDGRFRIRTTSGNASDFTIDNIVLSLD